MLPKNNRIRKEADFWVVYRYGKSFSRNGLILKIKDNNLGFVRLGVSVGLKFSSKAVVRNKIKRQIRCFFQKNFKKMTLGQDFIVIIGKSWKEKNNPSEILEEILIQNNLIKE